MATPVLTTTLLGAWALAVVLLPERVCASAFLGQVAPEPGPPHEGLQQRRAILAELEDVLGGEHRRTTEARLSRLEEALRPTFMALPKSASGLLGAAAARYALHRLFVQLHGWQVRGLETAGESWAGVSPVEALEDRVPGQVLGLFQDRLGHRGLDLHELAVLAATFEHLIHGEAVGRLQAAYRAVRRPLDGALSQPEAAEVMDTYMAVYIIGANVSTVPPESLLQQSRAIGEVYPSWPETQAFLREVQREIAPGTLHFTFEGVTAVVEAVGERFGRWQDAECRTLKAELMELEDVKGSGRVRLADFYGSALHAGKWQFSESAGYLRQLGALDDSDPTDLSVIIPNYVNGPSNCIASSSYYGVCCIDECEDILGQLEGQIGGPTASPDDIAALVAALPSASVPGNRTLPAKLLARLDEVAQHHGGRIPLHGRLFAQWLHHAYPRECPFPHVSGTTRPQRAEEWAKEVGQKPTASREEMQQHAEAARSQPRQTGGEEGTCSMWTMEEELVDVAAHRAEAANMTARVAAGGARGATVARRAALRGLALLAALGSFALALARILGPALAPHGLDAKAKAPGPQPDEQAGAAATVHCV